MAKYHYPILKDTVLKYVSSNKDSRKYIGIHPFANDPIRRLYIPSVEKLIHILNDMDYTVVIFGSKKESLPLKQMLSLDDTKCLFSFESESSNTVSNNTLELLSQCHLVLSSDSVFTHLCQGLNIPNIHHYGSFDSETRVGKYKNCITIDTNPECRCNKHGIGSCIKQSGNKMPKCMRLDPIWYISAIKQLLNGEKSDIEFPKFDSQHHIVIHSDKDLKNV
jgi:ADP-heptose:LPS heptosyltransferase